MKTITTKSFLSSALKRTDHQLCCVQPWDGLRNISLLTQVFFVGIICWRGECFNLDCFIILRCLFQGIDRIILVGGDNETLNKIKQDVEGTDVVNLLQIQEKLPHSAFTAEKMNASVVDVFLTTQQMLCEAIVSTSSKYQNHDSPVEPKKYSLKASYFYHSLSI